MQYTISRRIWAIDFIRGIAVLLMIFDHLMFSMYYYYSDLVGNFASIDGFLSHIVNFANSYWHTQLRFVVRQIVLIVFFVLSGLSSTFSRSNILRGSSLLMLSYILSVGTLMFNTDANGTLDLENLIMFGVLHCLAFCMLIYGVITKFKAQSITSLSVICVVIFILAIVFNNLNLQLRITGFDAIGVSKFNYENTLDYFPLIPYLGIFLFGSIVGLCLNRNKLGLQPKYRPVHIRAVNFLGRHALVIYFLHQAVFIGIYFIITLCI